MKEKKIFILASIFAALFVAGNVFAAEKPITKIDFRDDIIFLEVGDGQGLALFTPSDTDSEIIITNSNPEIASAEIETDEEDGTKRLQISGLENGETNIVVSATDNDGVAKVDSAKIVVSSYQAKINDMQVKAGTKANDRTGGVITIEVDSDDVNTLECSTEIEGATCVGDETGKEINITIPENITKGEYTVTIRGKYNYKYVNGNATSIRTLSSTETDTTFNIDEYVAVTKVEASPVKTGVGEITLNPVITPSNASITGVTYTTESSNIIITSTGIMANGKGTATITITSNDTLDEKNISTNVTVEVYDPKFDTTNATITGGYNNEYNSIYTDYNGTITIPISDITNINQLDVYKNEEKITTNEITFALNNEKTQAILTIHGGIEAGNYQLKLVGTYEEDNNIIARSEETTYSFEVKQNILISEITSQNLVLNVGNSVPLSYTINNDAINKNVTTVIADTAIASISEGNIIANAKGTTTLTITAEDNGKYSQSFEIKVTEPNVNYNITETSGGIASSPTTIYKTYIGTIKGSYTKELVNDIEIKILNSEEVDKTEDFTIAIDKDKNTFTINTKKTTSAGAYTIIINGLNSNNENIVDGTSTNKNFTITDVGTLESISAAPITIAKNGKTKIIYTTTPAIVASDEIEYSIKDGSENYISLDNDEVTGKNRGNGIIVLSSKNNLVDPVELTISVIEPSISINNYEITGGYDFDATKAYEGYTNTINATFTPNEEVNKLEIKIYNSQNEDVTSNFNSTYSINDKTITILTNNTINAGTYTAKIKVQNVVEESVIAETENTELTFEVQENILVSEITSDEMNIRSDFNGKIKYTLKGTEEKEPTNKNVTFSGYDATILTIAEDGTISPIKTGTTNVTVTSADKNHVTGTVKINVVVPTLTYSIEKITGTYDFDTTKIYQYFGGTIEGNFESLAVDKIAIHINKINENAEPTPADGLFSNPIINYDTKKFTITLSDSLAIASDYELVINGYKEDGETKIVDGTSENKSFKVEENPQVTSITATNIVIKKGDDIQLNPTIAPEEALNKNVAYSIVEGNEYIELSNTGLITAKKSGTSKVKIKATDFDAVEKIIDVKVVDPKITIATPTIVGDYYFDATKIYANHTGTISGTLIFSDATETNIQVFNDKNELDETSFTINNYQSNDTNYVINVLNTVKSGKYKIVVTSKYKDEDQVIASASSEKEFTIEENVYVESIIADKLYLAVDELKELSYAVSPINATNDDVIITIPEEYNTIITKENGKIKGLAEGNAKINVTAKDRETKSIEIDVVVSSIGLNLSIDSISGSYTDVSSTELYEEHGGTVVVKAVPSEELDVTYKLYDLENNLIDAAQSTNQETGKTSITITPEITNGTYKIVATVSKGEEPNIIKVSDYKYINVLKNIKVKEIRAQDRYIVKKGTTIPLEYELIADSEDANAQVTNPNVEVIVCNGETDCILIKELPNINADEAGEATIEIRAKDGSNKNKIINVQVVDVELTASIDENGIVGDYNIDTTKIYKGHNGTITGIIESQYTDELEIKLYDSNNNELTGKYTYTLGDKVNNKNTFQINVNATTLDAGEYRINIVGRKYNQDQILLADKDYDLHFNVTNNILIESINASESIKIGKGKTKAVQYTLNPTEVTNASITIESSDEDIVKINGNSIEGLEVGNATITLKTNDGSQVEKTIAVEVIETTIELKSVTTTGESEADRYIFNRAGTISGRYSASNNNAATELKVYKGTEDVTNQFSEPLLGSTSFTLEVGSNLDSGNYKLVIKASYVDGTEEISNAFFEINFTVSDGSSEITANNMRVSMGDRPTVDYTGTGIDVSFTVTDESILSITNGIITPLSIGSTQVRIYETGNEENSATITIEVYEEMVEETEYTIEEDFIINKNELVTIDNFVNSLKNDGTYEIKIIGRNSQEEKTTGYIGTGDRIVKSKNGISTEYTVVIPGDTSGDGRITSLDFVIISEHIMADQGGKAIEKPEDRRAADYYRDNRISSRDFVEISEYIMSK